MISVSGVFERSTPPARRVISSTTVGIVDGRIADVAEARGDVPPRALELTGQYGAARPRRCAHTPRIGYVALARSRAAPALHGEEPRPRELGYLLLAQVCRALLEAGVTTIRDVGSFDDEAITMRRGRARARAGPPHSIVRQDHLGDVTRWQAVRIDV